jgi:hypothetical protein
MSTGRYVPSPLEFGNRCRALRVSKVLPQAKSEHAGKADCHVIIELVSKTWRDHRDAKIPSKPSIAFKRVSQASVVSPRVGRFAWPGGDACQQFCAIGSGALDLGVARSQPWPDPHRRGRASGTRCTSSLAVSPPGALPSLGDRIAPVGGHLWAISVVARRITLVP